MVFMGSVSRADTANRTVAFTRPNGSETAGSQSRPPLKAISLAERKLELGANVQLTFSRG